MPQTPAPVNDQLWDCIVIGGGPGGLSAALNMGRMRRRTLVMDDHHGRSTWHQINRNYLGFPDGIHASALRDVGEEQCRNYGVEFVNARAISASVSGEGRGKRVTVGTSQDRYTARTLILATGVTDKFPRFEGWDDCVGRTMFWCIICDGYESIGKRVVVLGSGERAASLALQLKVFTDDVVLISWDADFTLSEGKQQTLAKHGVRTIEDGCAEFVCGSPGHVTAIVLGSGARVELDLFFVAQTIEPNTQLAKELGLYLDDEGYIQSDAEQATNIEGVYAAGDVTRLFNHQVTSAVHEGGMAAAAANYYLYEDWQKEN